MSSVCASFISVHHNWIRLHAPSRDKRVSHAEVIVKVTSGEMEGILIV